MERVRDTEELLLLLLLVPLAAAPVGVDDRREGDVVGTVESRTGAGGFLVVADMSSPAWCVPDWNLEDCASRICVN